MKRKLHPTIMSLAALVFFAAGVTAQDQTEVSILVKKDGKVIQDTTYQFDDAAEAEQVVKMIGVLGSDDEHMEHVTYNYTSTLSEKGGSKKMVFISEDGTKTEIKEVQGDTLVWISEKDGEGENIVKQKHIKVVISDDERSTWNVIANDGEGEGDDENVMILKDDGGNIRIEKIIEEQGDGEDVKVIIIKKSGDGDVEVDHEIHQDMDADHNVEVDVKVVNKKQKEE